MEYPTFVPPFYSYFTPPFYSTFTTIPVPLPNLNFSHGYTPPSPKPYTSSASYFSPYGYQQQPNHPYYNPANYQTDQNNPISSMDFQKLSLEFFQASQKSKDNLRAIDEQIQASRHFIKASFQEMFETLAALSETSHEVLQEQLQEELVEKDLEEKPEEAETFVNNEQTKTVVQLAQMGTEVTNPQERGSTSRTTEGKKKFANLASNRPPSPPPYPPDSSIFTKRNGSFTANLFAISMLKPPEKVTESTVTVAGKTTSATTPHRSSFVFDPGRTLTVTECVASPAVSSSSFPTSASLSLMDSQVPSLSSSFVLISVSSSSFRQWFCSSRLLFPPYYHWQQRRPSPIATAVQHLGHQGTLGLQSASQDQLRFFPFPPFLGQPAFNQTMDQLPSILLIWALKKMERLDSAMLEP